jgi:hypothetical protein
MEQDQDRCDDRVGQDLDMGSLVFGAANSSGR